MTDWKHEDLERLRNEVRDFEPIDPSKVEHPSRAELDAYVAETVSPFMARWIAGHADTCEVCNDYLLQAYEAEEEAHEPEATRVVGFPSRAASWWRPAAAAAMWILAIPIGAWLASFMLVDPVIIQAGPTAPTVSPAMVATAAPVSDALPSDATAARWSRQDLQAVEDVVRSVMSEKAAAAQAPLDVEALVRRTAEETRESFEARFVAMESLRRQDQADLQELILKASSAGAPCAPDVRHADAPVQPKPFFGYQASEGGVTE